MNRKFWIILMLVLYFSFHTMQGFAASENPLLSMDGKPLDSKAIVKNGTLRLPLEAVTAALGYSMDTSIQDQLIIKTTDDNAITIDLTEAKVSIQSHDYYLNEIPAVTNGMHYFSADFFSDSLNLRVYWDRSNNTVYLGKIKENEIEINTIKESFENDILKVSIQYPAVKGLKDQKIQDKLNYEFKQLADLAIQKGEKNAKELADYAKDFPDMPKKCETYFNYQIKYNQNGLLSLIFLDYQFAGGAHGGTIQTAFTFDLQTGEQFKLQDFFTDDADYLTIFNDQIQTLLSQRGLLSLLFEPFTGMNLSQPFYLSKNGFVVFYQQYEILPYSEGIQEFQVDYNLLEDILRDPYTVLLKE
ncbi:PdaC/SigV domain-containing protein [Flexilinea flocculi]|jgi:hypothetical protein|uniref:Copper amine oxidase N-terminal domain n=1 Tax=Flexilinea flocculi TaxID=1678840 RepID=A0A0S7BVS1_9CHLR|nr:DUF4163 domain-containing protein [Flexilinea flocculi]GAP40664.1 hypothetical protein ATC1_13643 [Flexilinea flocculi]